MEAVDCVGHTVLGRVECLDFGRVAQIGLSGNDISSPFGSFRLNDVGKNEVHVGSLGIFKKFAGELSVSAVSRGELTTPPSHPPAPVMRTTFLWAVPLTAVGMLRSGEVGGNEGG